jgi:hypothetical protein
MSAAFADTCKALGLSEEDHPLMLMPLVAQHVMGLGQRGVKSRTVLSCSRLNSLDHTGSERASGRYCLAKALQGCVTTMRRGVLLQAR